MLSISDVKAEIEEVARDGAGNYLLLSRHVSGAFSRFSRPFQDLLLRGSLVLV